MATRIGFTPIYGAYSSESTLCYLLEINDYKILLDCGWTERFDVSLLEPLEPILPNIDAVLLSHPDLEHLGGIAYAVGKLGLNAPIYSTIPVYKMGQMFLYDAHQSRQNYEEFDVFDLDDVDEAFRKFIQLKYSQHERLQGKGEGIEITPYPAGHMLGGTIWKITKETDDILYAVDFNHKKERHLNPTMLSTISFRPSLLITDCKAFDYSSSSSFASSASSSSKTSKKSREMQLIDTIMERLRAGGDVLLPVDTAGRVLELMLILSNYWTKNRLHTNYKLAFLSNFAYNAVDFARSQLEWMSDDIQNSFDNHRENPFTFQDLHLIHTRADLEALERPVVLLATLPSLDAGFSRELFVEWAEKPNNLVLLTKASASNSLASQLYPKCPASITIKLNQRVPLQGEELEEYQANQKAIQEEENRRKLKQQAIEKEEEENASRDDSLNPTEDMDLQAIAYSSINKYFQDSSYDLLVHPSDSDSDDTSYNTPMYPCYELTSKWDEYGEQIDPNLYEIPEDQPLGDNEAKTDALTASTGSAMDVDQNPKEEPTKCIVIEKQISIKCKIEFIDYEGRADARSIKNILTQVAPRKLIIINGSEKATNQLKAECEKLLTDCKEILTPRINERVEATSVTSIYKLRIKDSLYNRLPFAKVVSGGGGAETRECSVAFVDGQVHILSEGLPILEEIPIDRAPGHDAVFIGDVKLSDFKQTLTKSNLHADFVGGRLVCGTNATEDAVVSFKREEMTTTPTIQMDGFLCEDYFKIRNLLYSQYQIL
eukprot:TRINITY_DN3882_c0_g1_i1.p1 TRINITY_DN3882_c0_g1~~TRINITY_DN3882_c0_g1_i1.p1  ORF type:complete len:787 (-),score=164.62 TRINITY_DN3882_c0_g1_i1:39-2354(-)